LTPLRFQTYNVAKDVLNVWRSIINATLYYKTPVMISSSYFSL